MTTIVDIIAQAQQPARDRTAAFCATVDAHLAKLPDDAARHRFCEASHARWIGLYELWAQAVDSGKIDVKPGDPCAWDYTMTIAAIAARKAKYAPAVAA